MAVAANELLVSSPMPIFLKLTKMLQGLNGICVQFVTPDGALIICTNPWKKEEEKILQTNFVAPGDVPTLSWRFLLYFYLQYYMGTFTVFMVFP